MRCRGMRTVPVDDKGLVDANGPRIYMVGRFGAGSICVRLSQAGPLLSTVNQLTIQ